MSEQNNEEQLPNQNGVQKNPSQEHIDSLLPKSQQKEVDSLQKLEDKVQELFYQEEKIKQFEEKLAHHVQDLDSKIEKILKQSNDSNKSSPDLNKKIQTMHNELREFKAFFVVAESKMSYIEKEFENLEELQKILGKGNFIQNLTKEISSNFLVEHITPLRIEMARQFSRVHEESVQKRQLNDFEKDMQLVFKKLEEKIKLCDELINGNAFKFNNLLSECAPKTDVAMKIEALNQDIILKIGLMVKRTDFDKLARSTEHFVSIDQFAKITVELEQLKHHVNTKMATKLEMSKEDSIIRQWTLESFPTIIQMEDRLQQQKKVIDDVIEVSQNTQREANATLEKLSIFKNQLELMVQQKLDLINQEIQHLNNLMQKVALYQDFQELHDKLMPALEINQRQVEMISKEQQQNKIMILRLDQSLGLCAQKFEIIEYKKELKNFCKTKVFEEHASRVDKVEQSMLDELKQLEAYVQENFQLIQSSIRDQIQNKIITLQARVTKQISAQSLAPNEVELLKGLTTDIPDLLKSKAEAVDLVELRESKTNKQDTEQCMTCIEVLHRMIENLSVLQIEVLRKKVDSTKISIVAQQEANLYLMSQAINIGTWIKSFNPLGRKFKHSQDFSTTQFQKDIMHKSIEVSQQSDSPFQRPEMLPSDISGMLWNQQTRNKSKIQLKSIGQTPSVGLSNQASPRQSNSNGKWNKSNQLSQSLNLKNQNISRISIDLKEKLPQLRINQSSALDSYHPLKVQQSNLILQHKGSNERIASDDEISVILKNKPVQIDLPAGRSCTPIQIQRKISQISVKNKNL